ncbi:hypothetical protein GCM10011416_06880 [Polaribacter pacificus]|uniref:Outer membrane lipoprotein-sorting protein n=1 Tax=Polaribacter pacificus TaxID=1775173 RepID=A0A917HWR0_9FLAO|nr:DUF6503 family protein [Polaribacter pacificus]GGG92590.1 hypothetical protein GCM10011416_06880 [Polaribacter pacificus]
MKNLLILAAFFFTISSFSQELTGNQLLEKAIQYHDPNGSWSTFKGTLLVTMETPNSQKRESEIHIDLPDQFFSVKAKSGKNTSEYILKKDRIDIVFNGEKNPSEEISKKYGLSEDRAKMYKNYYTYLYGLPMKLKDKGTIIHQKTIKKTFKGKEYVVLKVTYTKEVGKDTWYFYFDPKTFAMEIYQFFHDETKNDGEYILLSKEETINGLKLPKNRAWFTNKEEKHLGTDILKAAN